MTAPTDDPPAPRAPAWYTELPGWSRALMQLGFAGLIAILFAADSRERSRQLADFQVESRQQAREDRQMYREEAQAQRTELRGAVNEMRRAIDHLDARHIEIKRDLDPLTYPAPYPRDKP